MIRRGRHLFLLGALSLVAAGLPACGGKVVHEVGAGGSTAPGGATGSGAGETGAAGNGASGSGGSDSGGTFGGQGFAGSGPGGGGVGGAVECPPDAPVAGDPCPLEGVFCNYPGFCMGFTCYASGWVPPPC